MDPNEHWTAYLLALLAGLIYAGGAITGKTALELGCGQVRVVILSNLILSACFIPHLFLSPGWPTLWELGVGAGLGSIFCSPRPCFSGHYGREMPPWFPR